MKSHLISSGARPEGFQWTGGETVDRNTRMSVEALIGDPNYKSIWWLEAALDAARSVARVKLPGGSATGFLIASDIIMTNNHVFEDENDAKSAVLQFNYRLLANGEPVGVDEWKCDPDSMFKTNPDLDYTIVKVSPKNGDNAGDNWGFFNLRHGTSVFKDQRVNIIQHPQGRFKEIAFRDNQVKDVADIYTISYRY